MKVVVACHCVVPFNIKYSMETTDIKRPIKKYNITKQTYCESLAPSNVTQGPIVRKRVNAILEINTIQISISCLKAFSLLIS